MPKTGGNIYKRKDGRWEGRYAKDRKEDGTAVYGYVYAKTCTEVKRKLALAAVTSSTGIRETAITFSDIAQRWLFHASIQVKESTYAHYAAVLRNHILPTIGIYQLRHLTAEHLDQFAGRMLQYGRMDGIGGLSPKTVRDLLSVVKSVLDFARAQGVYAEDLTVTYPKSVKPSIRILSQQEQLALEHVLLGEPNIIKLGILLCLYTGLRLGEVCALRWKDISLERHTVSVRQTMQRIQRPGAGSAHKTTLLIGTPKTAHSERDIPLPAFFSKLLTGFASVPEHYFLSNQGFIYIEPRTLQNYFKRYLTEAGIAPANYHALRHTFATRCIEAGVDIKSLSEILGHADVNITLNRYVHSSFEQKREGIRKLEQFLRDTDL